MIGRPKVPQSDVSPASAETRASADGVGGEEELGHTLRIIYACVTCLAPVIASMSLGFTSPALDTMKGDVKNGGGHAFEVDASLAVFAGGNSGYASWFSSLVNVGALVGAFSGGFVCKSFGQRNALRIAALQISVAWAWIASLSDPGWMCLARMIIGVGVGLQSVAAPAFISEMSPPELRGRLGTTNAAGILLGVFFVDVVGGSFTRTGPDGAFCAWRQLSLTISALAAAVVLGSFILPPAPTFCRDPTLPPTPSLMSPSVGRIASSAHGGVLLAVAGLLPMVWQQLSGINAVVFFGQSILADAGVQNADLCGDAVILIQLFGVGLAAALIEHVGRRPLLLVSIAGMALAACSLSALLRLSEDPPAAGVFCAMGTYVLFFSVGLGPVPWLLLPELGMSKDKRAKLSSFATASNWACSFAVTGPPLSALQAACGLWGVFAAFGSGCAVATVLFAYFVPETQIRRRAGLERRFSMG
eukprot:TRINITY_DN42013_c0_g1_i1.p1 TRINITY_DN42013_c0_g1~~TRINITY_DN42013_c0_g1_i1.p1  ORF type:complete len:474 (-),score=92.86 TRINITY_DN42013_c0_g1_i1:186-1607(-)